MNTFLISMRITNIERAIDEEGYFLVILRNLILQILEIIDDFITQFDYFIAKYNLNFS